MGYRERLQESRPLLTKLGEQKPLSSASSAPCSLRRCTTAADQVDFLMKLSVEDDPDYMLLVTVSRFLAVTEGMFGLASKSPPD